MASDDFRASLALICRAYEENKPQVVRLESSMNWMCRTKAILCLPFDVEGRTLGVLYHENSYLDTCFDFLDKDLLIQVARYLSTYIGQIHRYSVNLEKHAYQRTSALEKHQSPEIIGQSPVMEKILAQADRTAASESTVLILGETGVGKELMAHRIHRMSRRSENPLVIVDATTIPEHLVESELFGHEMGAFTGADHQKKGRMELADKGTLFIDEIGEIPKSMQVKLLRVLQEKTLVRIGGMQAVSSDFRLLVATNRDLAQEVIAGRFREDLYYRLNVIPITVPSLRERREDIPLLAEHFLNRYAAKYNFPKIKLTPENEARLQEYDWPGNVRQLQKRH